ncbi:XRE family transcriptional regulator [Sphingomonas gei]|uniref:XRE family transcriptional regulator n=1 Tax=Sphingomonas gei TaxID=1395960 RepID=A0A4S1WYT9_9SPHN|nr:XRE family transcriptional regulator [Sphingomonas gei]TGX48744.1 XRE family transcriptional regulator [Sphingomonas gei]
MAGDFSKGRIQARPGAALKALRSERGLTLADVSGLTGMNVSTLSKIENGKVALTLDKLLRISDGLGVDMTELFGPGPKDAPKLEGATRRSITRAGEGRAIEMPRGNYLYVASELLNKRITPIIGDVFARDIAEYGELMRHAGEEYVYVLEGTLELHTELYTPARLEKGDSVYFDSQMGHAYIAVGDAPCRILSICATSEAHMVEAHANVAEAEHVSNVAARTKRLANAGQGA